jgi:hypothetical protein
MKIQSILTALMAMALMFTGCAGKSVNPAPIAPKDPLRTHVPESFHFSVENSETLRYLAEVNLKSLAPDQRLEVIVLRQLVEVSSEKELIAAFDSLWESQKQIRELVNKPRRRSEYLIPMTEIYYLLSAGPAASWQAETAERIYRETLHSVQPHQLSGYSLHFYTLALLKNGKIDVAEPFLLRLENFTAPHVYLQDIAVAMEYAIAAKKYQSACRFIAALCRTGTRHNLELPDGKICSAIRALEKAGRLDLALTALKPQVLGNPDLRKYSFVRLLNKTGKKFSGQSHIETMAKDVKPIHTPTSPGPESTRPEIKTSSATIQRKILIKVQIISAGNQSNYTDPDLYEIGKYLRETLNFTSFTLIGEEKLRLKTGEKGVLHLTQGHSLQIIPQSISDSISRIEVAITKGNRQLLHTLIESVDEGATIIGGPQSEDKAVLLRIITFLPEQSHVYFSGRQAA